MRQTRIHTHDKSHVDTEQLFGDVWAVTQCNCTLVTQEAGMLYNGYTESEAMKADRAERLFTDYKTNFQLTHTSERDASDLRRSVMTYQNLLWIGSWKPSRKKQTRKTGRIRLQN
jgi:hypothetical protein